MNARTYKAKTIQEALDQIKRELGPEGHVISERTQSIHGAARVWLDPKPELGSHRCVKRLCRKTSVPSLGERSGRCDRGQSNGQESAGTFDRSVQGKQIQGR